MNTELLLLSSLLFLRPKGALSLLGQVVIVTVFSPGADKNYFSTHLGWRFRD
jgi:hypothetical protein